jgi:hypothetical protein
VEKMQQETRYQNFKNEIEFQLRSGGMNIQDIYRVIQLKYPSDCDDREPCEHKGHFYQYGEWKHLVRSALQKLKKDRLVKYHTGNDIWIHI